MEQPLLLWGYDEDWMRRGKGGTTNSVDDNTVRGLLTEHIARQRGSTISYKRIVTMLVMNDIRPNPRALKDMLERMGLVIIGRTYKAKAIYRLPSV